MHYELYIIYLFAVIVTNCVIYVSAISYYPT